MLQKFTLDEKIAFIFMLFDEDDRLNEERIKNIHKYKFWSDIPGQLLELLLNALEDSNLLNECTDEDINNVVSELIEENKLNIFKNFNISMFKHTMKILPDKIYKELEKRKKLTSDLNFNRKSYFDMDKFDELKKKLDIEICKSKKNIKSALKQQKEFTDQEIKKIEEKSKEEIDKLFKYYTNIGNTVLNSVSRGNYSLLKQSTNKLKNKYQIDGDIFIEKVIELSKIREELRISKFKTKPLYRGLGINRFLEMINFSVPQNCENMDDLLKEIKKSKINTTIQDIAILSTSESEQEALSFAVRSAYKCRNNNSKDKIFSEAVAVIIIIDLGDSYVLGKNISYISEFNNEQEVLIQPGQRFEINNLEVKNVKDGMSGNIKCLYVTVRPLHPQIIDNK